MLLFSVITYYHKAFNIIVKKGDDKHPPFLSAIAVKPPTLGGGYKAPHTL